MFQIKAVTSCSTHRPTGGREIRRKNTTIKILKERNSTNPGENREVIRQAMYGTSVANRME